MNDRQIELVKTLVVHIDRVFHVQELADQFECSEKTIRNDLKVVETFLEKESGARLVRKPGVGLSLSVDEGEKTKLVHLLYQTNESNEERVLEIAYQLLVEDKAVTLKKLADQYFTTTADIRKDLLTIAPWLKTFHLDLVSKQRLGSTVVGDELDKRNALAHLSELVSKGESVSEYILHLFPAYEVDTVRQAFRKVERYFALELSDGAVESLVIHALVMIKRTRQRSKILIKATDKDVAFQAEEYEMTTFFISDLERVLRLTFPEEEKVYFTWHLMSVKRLGVMPRSSGMDDILEDVIEKLTFQLQVMTMKNFQRDRMLLDGLEIHLQSTIHRVRYGLTIRNPMLMDIKKMYPYMFSMVVLALEEVNRVHSLKIPEDEAAYLVLHFQASIERLERQRSSKKRVIIVCELGVGMSHLLEAKLEQTYKGIEIVACTEERNVERVLDQYTVNFIISTKALPISDVPHIVISPLLKTEDKEKLDRFLQELESSDRESPDIQKLVPFLQERFIFLDVPKMHRFEVIEMMSRTLVEHGWVDPSFLHGALLRERSSATSIGGGVAIPHAHPEKVNRSVVAMAVFNDPLEWGEERVSIVFLLAISKEDQRLTRSFMQIIAEISTKPDIVQRLIEAKNTSEILNSFVQ